MSVGFGNTTQTSNQYISNFIKQVRNRVDPSFTQDMWYKEYSSREYSYSLSDLLEPKFTELAIEIDAKFDWVRDTHKHLQSKVLGENGLWKLNVTWDRLLKIWDLTISVDSGGLSRFHPDVIEEDISRKYGRVVYKQWQAMVMDDLDSLKTLVNEVRDRIDFVAPSIVCCERSARLCRRVGIPVKGQYAFLFPSSYSL